MKYEKYKLLPQEAKEEYQAKFGPLYQKSYFSQNYYVLVIILLVGTFMIFSSAYALQTVDETQKAEILGMLKTATLAFKIAIGYVFVEFIISTAIIVYELFKLKQFKKKWSVK